MLAILGFFMMLVFMVLIMTKRLSVLTALVLTPIVFALIAGFGFSDVGDMMISGIQQVAPTAVMIMFAILYFGIMIDTGLFDPMVTKILKMVKGDPLKIVVGTAVLTMLVALDGDGSTTYMITTSAMLPLYLLLGIRPIILAGIAGVGMGIMNTIPWGGATPRAASALGVDPAELTGPMIPVIVSGMLCMIGVAYMLGKAERKRLGVIELKHPAGANETAAAAEDEWKRPNWWFNLLLTLSLIGLLISGKVSLTVLFIIAFCIALIVNYPNLDHQRQRISAHSSNVLAIGSMIFAAGVFTGILTGTKMVDEMAISLASMIPEQMGGFIPMIVALTSGIFTFLMPNDAYFYGVLPILSETAVAYGVNKVEIARASIIGQPIHMLSPLVPSTHLLVGLVGVSIDDHQKFAIKWAVLAVIVMTGCALLIGSISIY
ncbi:citrate:proton symporter [Bacillus licheniformis]|uniref:citrate:proton symporter n=1 Tax=Bacillus licheniformis TaxID=1402 RepID=UPI0011BFB3C5|nr:citrate:proton symporter [Bacillus licheniformis]MBK4209879.1 citrate transporter [Bacillus licheniformis]TWM52459.1 Mg(2+)/citrate complex secondary transporter [Bacillus licheniformis]